MKKLLIKNWKVLTILLVILFLAYYVRSIGIVPDRLVSFDPVFQYRFTRYLAEWGHLPVWDELTYYVGRAVEGSLTQPMMYYVVVLVFSVLKFFGMSLATTASYMSAILGALIILPAFLLGRELSNKYGGLLAAALIGFAPQVLIRTFGSSYDTDQIVIFFLLLTIYLGVYALRKKTIPSFCLAVGGFVAFMLTWSLFWYSFFMITGIIIIYFLMDVFFKRNIKSSLIGLKKEIMILIGLFASLIGIGFLTNSSPLIGLRTLFSFASAAEEWIVNISIAELQAINLADINTWMTAMGRFVSGDNLLDILIFSSFLVFIGVSLAYKIKENNIKKATIITLIVLGIFTLTRGIRFTEFSTGIFIVVIGAGFGYLYEWSKKENMFKVIVIGFAIFIALTSVSLGLNLGSKLGPDINPNWDSAWAFLKEETPELSLVGTWWDPGHMIAGYAERRNIADGAHCYYQCHYNINDRITDLGTIMATNDESKSLELIRKYQGTSPKVYWIASDDLIGKFRWVQFFGLGCDGTADPSCPLYIQLPYTSDGFSKNKEVYMVEYGEVSIIQGTVPLPILKQGRNAFLFSEVIFYPETNKPSILNIEEMKDDILASLRTYESELDLRFSNRTLEQTIWVPQHSSYIVVIPANLRDSVFTRMFMLEGAGLEHFRQVFRNEQVKIYEVV